MLVQKTIFSARHVFENWQHFTISRICKQTGLPSRNVIHMRFKRSKDLLTKKIASIYMAFCILFPLRENWRESVTSRGGGIFSADDRTVSRESPASCGRVNRYDYSVVFKYSLCCTFIKTEEITLHMDQLIRNCVCLAK